VVHKKGFSEGKACRKMLGERWEKEQGGCNGFAGEEEFAYL
jgi:hypothetical protein